MVQVVLTSNAFSGNLPTNNGIFLPNLEVLHLDANQLTGNIPSSRCNSSKLTKLILAANLFTGPVPKHLGDLKHLELLHLSQNQLTNEPGSIELSFLTDLTNCTSLVELVVGQNKLSGILPNSIGNLSNSLEILSVSRNPLIGTIPKEIGSLRNVTVLALAGNNLDGNIPSTLGDIKSLQRLYLGGNNFHGSIPNEICLLTNLGELYAEENKLCGSIPSCIENLRGLQVMKLSHNKLTFIPSSLWNLETLRD
ncbi:probable leucine-rich repeat receptor-like protein kinase At1g35710 [Camellia sinensis]|uniref:probable leucine-rich repeat receptor-like protein kinase At1g35710 n=1 Tax=Camellia sinensis TaxID=4442 RepID=UPI001036A75F|nr:probable leucine-rich repeat receptor-like protein kinase At1g35710 [Camellia sinensis]